MARSRLDEFAEHGAIGHTRSALWHGGALAAHGTAGSLQTLGNVAGVTASVVDTSVNVLTGLPHPITQSMAIMNRLAGAAMSGMSGGGQVLSAAGSAANSATGQALGAMQSAASSSARWERRADGIYDRVVDPVVRAAVETAL